MNEDLYEMAMYKCENDLNISLSTLVKIFLRSFITQKGVGFYVGDDNLCDLFRRWFMKQQLRKDSPKDPYYAGPYLKDLFRL